MAAGEGAKRRQDRTALAHHEAGQTQGIATAGEPVHRMHVAGQHMALRAFLRMMAKGEGADRMRLVHHHDLQVGRRIAGTVVMVAPHQRQAQPRMPLAPGPDRSQRRRRMRGLCMQEDTQEQDVIDRMLLQQLVERFQVLCSGAGGYRNAEGAEGRGLAEMDVGDDQQALPRPVQCALRQQLQDFIGDGDVHAGMDCFFGRQQSMWGRSRPIPVLAENAPSFRARPPFPARAPCAPPGPRVSHWRAFRESAPPSAERRTASRAP